MITFFPRDIGVWRKIFDFEPDVTLTPKTTPNAHTGMVFHDRTELIEFLRNVGARLDDPQNPLRFERADEELYKKGRSSQGELFVVTQWTALGWIRDDYRG